MRTRRPSFPRLLLMCVALSLLMIPAPRASADLQVTRVLASRNGEFAPGKFGLTGLVEAGGVQLLPLGTLQRVSSTVALCRTLSSMGTASYPTTTVNQNGVEVKTTYLYVVGGRTGEGAYDTPVGQTCHAKVINQFGGTSSDPNTGEWTFDTPTLPLPSPYTGVSNNQAIAAKSSSGQGYLYSLGGAVGAEYFSIDKIYRAPINDATGAIGSWVTDALSMPGESSPGVFAPKARHNFTVTTYTDTNGATWLYLFGGMRHYDVVGTHFDEFFRDVWRTRVNANGSLGDGTASGWTKLANIPIRSLPPLDSCTGLVGAQAVNFDVFGFSNDTITNTLYLIGGRYYRTCSNSGFSQTTGDVFRATLGVNGALTWDSNASTGANIYTLNYGLFGHRAVGYNQKIYVIGGYGNAGSGEGAQTTAFGSYATEDQSLPTFGQANFIFNPGVLPDPRYDHGMLIAYYDNLPIIYTIGGRDSNATNASSFNDTVFTSIPTIDEQLASDFASSGGYISPAYDMRADAIITGMSWKGSVPGALQDIEISYRVAASESGLNGALWRPVDGDTGSAHFSLVGTNSVNTATVVGAPSARFVQYRAILRTGEGSVTPVIKEVAISMLLPGYPNAVIDSASLPVVDDSTDPVALTMKLANRAPAGSSEQVLPADIDGGGTIFVDLYIFGPTTPVITPTFGSQGADYLGDVFVEVNKADLQANGTYDIPTDAWMRSCLDGSGNPQSSCPPVDWRQEITGEGTWTIIAMVDSSNNLHEDTTLNDPGEALNFYRFTVVSEYTAFRTYMPMLMRPAPSGDQADVVVERQPVRRATSMVAPQSGP